jgi:hypothetical protein
MSKPCFNQCRVAGLVCISIMNVSTALNLGTLHMNPHVRTVMASLRSVVEMRLVRSLTLSRPFRPAAVLCGQPPSETNTFPPFFGEQIRNARHLGPLVGVAGEVCRGS